MLLICDFQFKKTLNYFDGILRKMARTFFMITEQIFRDLCSVQGLKICFLEASWTIHVALEKPVMIDDDADYNEKNNDADENPDDGENAFVGVSGRSDSGLLTKTHRLFPFLSLLSKSQCSVRWYSWGCWWRLLGKI